MHARTCNAYSVVNSLTAAVTVHWQDQPMYTVSQKRRHYTLVHIFAKY